MTSQEIKRKIEYHTKMLKWYSASELAKRDQRKEINYWTQILKGK